MPGQVHQIGTVFPIVNRECRVEPDLLGIVAQKPRADPVESPAQVRASVITPPCR